MKRPFVLFMLFIIGGLLILLPSVLQYAVKSGFTYPEKTPEPSYTGRLTLWHIGETVNTFGVLKKAADAFERKNIYVFIDCYNVSEKQALERLAKGEKPDIFTYCETQTLFETNQPKPYALSPYLLYVSDGNENKTIFSISDTVVKRSDINDYDIVDAMELDDTSQIQYEYINDAQEKFIKGEAGGLIAPLAFEYKLRNVSSVSYNAYVVFNYADQIRYGDTLLSDNELKNQMCRKFVDSLVSERVQKSVISAGHLCVVPNSGTVDYSALYDNASAQEAYFLLIEKGIFPTPLFQG